MQTIMIIYKYQTQPAVSKFLSTYNNQIDKKYNIKLLYKPINLKRLITKYNPNIIYCGTNQQSEINKLFPQITSYEFTYSKDSFIVKTDLFSLINKTRKTGVKFFNVVKYDSLSEKLETKRVSSFLDYKRQGFVREFELNKHLDEIINNNLRRMSALNRESSQKSKENAIIEKIKMEMIDNDNTKI